MTSPTLALTGLPAQRQAREEPGPAIGPLPWLTATGRLDRVLTAWGNGALGEVPAGVGFDVLTTPAALGRDAVRRAHKAGHRVGPVIIGPLGAEFLIQRGSAATWSAPFSFVLRDGALVLLPPPGDETRVVGARHWLISPCHPHTGAPLHAEVTPCGVLRAPFQEAVQAARARRQWPCAR